MVHSFKYIQPKSLQEAGKLLSADGKTAMLFAGGTDALGLIKDGIEQPKSLINLKALEGLNRIEYKSGEGLKIGALVKIADIAEHPIIKQKYSVLHGAASEVVSPQLRNQGTLGGNLCQRPRCWYFRGDFHCLRKGGDMCYAATGENKYHCIIGGDPCFIVHPSDMAVALLALDAKITIFSANGLRAIPINDFYLLPSQNVQRENILQPGEIITEITVPDLPKGTVSGYLKFKERSSWDFAIVSVGAVLQKDGRKITSGLVALGGVAPKAWLEAEVSAQLKNLSATEEAIAKVAQSALAQAVTLEKNGYKLKLAKNLVRRLLLKLNI